MLNDETPAARRYQDEVPAVARAVCLLERLAAGNSACSLAELARELGVGPSSLLAILTTLRRAGLVSRDRAGHYEVGPGLAALGTAAACRLRACERFAAIAETLVTTLGETVLLWVRQDETFVLAAAREGTQPLRYVPVPGLRLDGDQTGLTALLSYGSVRPGKSDADVAPTMTGEEELLPGVWTVAAALSTGADEQAFIALAGPRDRLQTPEVRSALLAVASGSSELSQSGRPALIPGAGEADGRWRAGQVRRPVSQTSGPIDGDELDAFL